MPNDYPPDYLEGIGRRFNAFIKAIKVSRQELADELGKTEQTIGYYATGHTLPPAKVVIYLSNKYNLSLDYLYSGWGAMILENGNHDEPKKYYTAIEELNMIMKQYIQCNQEREELQRRVEVLTAENEKLRNNK